MGIFTALIAGLVFGIGLVISGMVMPAKVLGFLDLAGAWDPSLGLVMVGAVAAGILAFTLAKRKTKSYLGFTMQLPSSKQIDKKLIFGGLLFGIGWGIAGFCPGPAIVNLGTGQLQFIVFVLALLLGMYINKLFSNRTKNNT